MLRKLEYVATTWGIVRARRPNNAGFMTKKPWDDAGWNLPGQMS